MSTTNNQSTTKGYSLPTINVKLDIQLYRELAKLLCRNQKDGISLTDLILEVSFRNPVKTAEEVLGHVLHLCEVGYYKEDQLYIPTEGDAAVSIEEMDMH